MAAFIKLPREIQDEIIAFIKIDSGVCTRAKEAENDGKHYDPPERHRRKETPPEIKTLIALSATCTYLRQMLAPYVFESVALSNNTKSALSVRALGTGSNRQYVKEIRYAGFPGAFLDFALDENDVWISPEGPRTFREAVDILFPSEVEDTLGNLTSLFPNLQSLTVEFPFLYDDMDFGEVSELYSEGRLCCDDDGQERETGDDAERFPWRILVCRSWASICNNEPKFRSLSILNFQCVKVPSFGSSSGLNPILENLKEFTISFQGHDNGAGWKLCRHVGFDEILLAMADEFFNHLGECETLRVDFDNSCAVGENDGIASSHPLESHHIPKLRHLHLSYHFIDNDIQNFILSHASTLETITLEDCLCSDRTYAWHELFRKMARKPMAKLQSIDLKTTYTRLYKGWDDDVPDEDHPEEEKMLVTEKRARGDRVYPYAYQDDKYGMLFVDCDANRRAYILGEDEKAYNLLRSKLVSP